MSQCRSCPCDLVLSKANPELTALLSRALDRVLWQLSRFVVVDPLTNQLCVYRCVLCAVCCLLCVSLCAV